MRSALLAPGAVLLASLTAGIAHAQRTAPKIWDIKLGISVAELPLADFVDPACGTNGGPPARVLKSFAEFAQCAVEPATGLREIWFRYDDEMEYVGRARRSDIMIRQYSTEFAGRPADHHVASGRRRRSHPGLSRRQRSARGQRDADRRLRPCRPVQGYRRLRLELYRPATRGRRAPDRRLVLEGGLRAQDRRKDRQDRSAALLQARSVRGRPER